MTVSAPAWRRFSIASPRRWRAVADRLKPVFEDGATAVEEERDAIAGFLLFNLGACARTRGPSVRQRAAYFVLLPDGQGCRVVGFLGPALYVQLMLVPFGTIAFALFVGAVFEELVRRGWPASVDPTIPLTLACLVSLILLFIRETGLPPEPGEEQPLIDLFETAAGAHVRIG